MIPYARIEIKITIVDLNKLIFKEKEIARHIHLTDLEGASLFDDKVTKLIKDESIDMVDSRNFDHDKV